MALLVNSLEGGTNTTTISTANSGGTSGDAFTTVQGSPKFTSSAITGGMAALFDTTTTQFLSWDDAASSAVLAGRFTFTLPSLPSADHQVIGIRTLTGTTGASIEISSTGQIHCTIQSFTSSYSVPVMSTGTVYRLEFQGTGFGTTSTALSVQIYAGATSGTVFASASVSGANTSAAGQAQRIRYGKPAGSATLSGLTMDDLAQNIGTSTAIGPPAYNASPAAGLAAATGTAYDVTPTNASASSGPVTVDAQTAFAGGSAPFSGTPISTSVEQVVDNPVAATGAANDAAPGVGPSAPIAGATGQAYDVTIVAPSNINVDAGLAASTGVAFDAKVSIPGSAFPTVASGIGEAFDATTTITISYINVDAGYTTDVVGTALDATIIAISQIFLYFTTPTVRRHGIRTGHGLYDRLYIDEGSSILRFGNSFKQIVTPDDAQMESADAVYIGGRTYAVPEIEAQLLRSAGYGHYVTDLPGVPIEEVDYTQYGVGLYGTGPYGA